MQAQTNSVSSEASVAQTPATPPNALARLSRRQTRRFAVMSLLIGVLIGSLALTLAWRQGVFEKKTRLTFETPTGQGLSKGMPILYKGFKIGYLDVIELAADASIKAEVVFREKYTKLITSGSTLRLSKDKIVTAELLLEPGWNSDGLMSDGATISLKTDGGIDALEKKVFERVDPLLANVNTLIARLGDDKIGVPPAVNALRQSLEGSRASFEELNRTLEQATKTLASLNRRVADPKVDAVLADAEKTLQGLTSNTASVNQTLAGITSNTQQFNRTLEGLTSNTAQINQTLEASRKLMETAQGLMQSTQNSTTGTTAEINLALKQMQRVLGETIILMEDMRRSTIGRWIVASREGIKSTAPPAPITPSAPINY